ncbi:ATP-binding protein [Streptomyces sp. NPDC086549]|uniref:ATP-binding protein n=1 Tax=Streptomyces sp. NPDC086549 TaxID=3365752 RepID=UPI00380B189C
MTVTCTYGPEAPPRQGPARSLSASVGTWTLAHRPEAAGEARKITKELLAQWSVAEDAADSVLLTVSELVTNAVEHARPPLNFGLSRDPGAQRVHIEVSDGGPAAMDGDWAGSCTPPRARPRTGDRRPAHRRARRPCGTRTRCPLGRRHQRALTRPCDGARRARSSPRPVRSGE